MICVERKVDIASETKIEPQTPCLSMRAKEAAKSLGISERLLWEWTDKGIIPHIRLGKAVLYPVDSLRDWLQRQAQTKNESR